MTSLHILAAKNFEFNKKIAELFLHAGADPNVKDFYGRTPLIVAAGSGNTDLVELFLKRCPNIDINAQTIGGETAAMKAIVYAKEDCLSLILQVPSLNK